VEPPRVAARPYFTLLPSWPAALLPTAIVIPDEVHLIISFY
jgi:hypothetical protein